MRRITESKPSRFDNFDTLLLRSARGKHEPAPTISRQGDEDRKRNQLLASTQLESKLIQFMHPQPVPHSGQKRRIPKQFNLGSQPTERPELRTDKVSSRVERGSQTFGSLLNKTAGGGFPSLSNLLFSGNRRPAPPRSERLSPILERQESSSRFLKRSQSRVSSPAFKLRLVNPGSAIAISEITLQDKQSHKESMMMQAQARLDMTKLSAMRKDRHKPARLKDFGPITPRATTGQVHNEIRTVSRPENILKESTKSASDMRQISVSRSRGERCGMSNTLYAKFCSKFLAKYVPAAQLGSVEFDVAAQHGLRPNHLKVHSKDFGVGELPNHPEQTPDTLSGRRAGSGNSKGYHESTDPVGLASRPEGAQGGHTPASQQPELENPQHLQDFGRMQIQMLVAGMVQVVDRYGVHEVAKNIPIPSKIDEKAANSLFTANPMLAKMLNNWGFINTPFKSKLAAEPSEDKELEEFEKANTNQAHKDGPISTASSRGHRTNKNKGWSRLGVNTMVETNTYVGKNGIRKYNPLNVYPIKLRMAVVESMRRYFSSLKRMGLNLKMILEQSIFPKEPFEPPQSSVLLEAVKQEDFLTCKRLLDANPLLVHSFDHAGLTALHWAALRSKHHILLLCLAKSSQVLLYFKADPDFMNAARETREELCEGDSGILTALQLADNIRTSRNLGTSQAHRACWIRAAKESFSEILLQVTSDPTNPFYDNKDLWIVL